METIKNKFFLPLVFLLVLVQILLAQKKTGWIEGKIVDADIKQPLIGANVVITGTQLGASTDQNGQFIIENVPEGSYSLEFSYIGYISIIRTDVVVKSGKPTILSVEMKAAPIKGEVIEVTAGYFMQEIKLSPSLITLSREEIRRFPGGFEDIVRTVATLPGVAINNGGGRNDLLVRGGGPSENLYVVNNIEVPNINHFGTQGTASGSLSFINLDLIENVDFSSGGFGPEYGDKMSSVLSLKLSEGRKDKFGAKFLVSATQFGLNTEGPLGEKGSFIFSARRSYLDFIFKAAGLPFTPVYTDFNLVGKAEISPSVNMTFLSLLALDDIDRLTDSEKDLVINASVMGNKQIQWINGINFQYLMNQAYMDVTLQANSIAYRFDQKDENLEKYFESKTDEIEYGIKLAYTRKLNKSVNFSFGTGIKIPDLNSRTWFADSIYDQNGRKIPFSELGIPQQLIFDDMTQKYFSYAKVEIPVGKNIVLGAGFRWDHYSFLNSRNYWSPRFNLKFKINEVQDIRVSAGRYVQAPSYVWTFNPENKNLKALQNDMVVLGWDYLLRKDLLMKVETYYKDYSNLPSGTVPGVNDYIVQTNTGLAFGGRDDNFKSFGFYPMASVGTGKAYGIEFQLQKKYSDIPFYGQISVSLGKSEVTAANGKKYPAQFDQRFIFNITGGYRAGNKWEFGGKFRIFTGAPYTPVYIPEQNPKNPGYIQNLPEEYLTKRLPLGHHLDLRVDRYFYVKQTRLTLYLDIQNIYNYKIPIIPSYNFWDKEIETSNAIGILPSIGFSAEF